MQASTAPTARRLFVVLAALVVTLLFAAPSASAAGQVSFKAKRIAGHSAVFRVRGVDAGSVSRAKLTVGRYRRRIHTSQMRRAARRGSLRVGLPRRVVKRLRRKASASRRRRAKLTVVLRDDKIYRPTGPVNGPVINFETGNFSEAANFSTESGSLNVLNGRGYEGSHSARATYSGNGAGFQRVWQDVNWGNGSDVWYGMAMYIPNTSDYCYWNPLRWDNYRTQQGNGDVGGLSIEGGDIHLIRSNYSREEHVLVDGGKAPQGRWFWIELHQKFSPNDGQALSELFVDGRKLGSSTKANSAGRQINNLRAGVVNVSGSCSRASAVDFDRVSISDGMRGPKA